MKKAYSKPIITFESFTLSTNIAAGCEYRTTSEALLFPGVGYVFVSGCDYPVGTDDGQYNGICYHVPIEAANVFAS